MHVSEIKVDQLGLERLLDAAMECAQPELHRITKSVIEDLKQRSANGTFGDLHARHVWDEYSWHLQEGPFDDVFEWDDVSLGSMSSAFNDLVFTLALTEIENLPKHLLVFLSALAFDRDDDLSAEDPWSNVGVTWPEGVAKMVVDQVNEVASERSLDLIGPDRADCIRYEASGEGVVWALLNDRGEAWDIVADHVDDLLDPDGDLEELAEALLDAFIDAAKEEVDDSVLGEYFEQHEIDIRNQLLAGDVMVNVHKMRAQVLERLDG